MEQANVIFEIEILLGFESGRMQKKCTFKPQQKSKYRGLTGTIDKFSVTMQLGLPCTVKQIFCCV